MTIAFDVNAWLYVLFIGPREYVQHKYSYHPEPTKGSYYNVNDIKSAVSGVYSLSSQWVWNGLNGDFRRLTWMEGHRADWMEINADKIWYVFRR